MKRRKEGGAGADTAAGRMKHRETQSEVRERQAPPPDDAEPPPTRIKIPRPPSRSMLEGDEHGAPTKVRSVAAATRASPSGAARPGAARPGAAPPAAARAHGAGHDAALEDDALEGDALEDDALEDDDEEEDLTRVKTTGSLMSDLEDELGAPTSLRRRSRGGGGSAQEDDEDARDSEPPPDSIPPPSARGDAPDVKLRRCQLGPVIAAGGMATIHLGRWYGAGGFAKTVAIKRLHRHLVSSSSFVNMLLDEAQVVARIRHANVTSVMDVVEEDGELFIVMDYVHGVTLAHLIRQMKRQGSKIPLPIAMRIASGILHGLQAAHDATDEDGNPLCVIHRDVSPENVIIGSDGGVQLIDFGVARAYGRVDRAEEGEFRGTLRYCSPEQLKNEDLEPASDIYAASIVLWEMATGRRLYRGQNAAAIIYEVLDGDPPPPSRYRDGLGRGFDEIVLRGLHPDKGRRWLTAVDMAEAIERSTTLASPREVAVWVKAIARDKLATMKDALKAVEGLPPLVIDESSSDGAASHTPLPAEAPRSDKAGMRWPAVVGLLVAGVVAGAFLFGGKETPSSPTASSAAVDSPPPPKEPAPTEPSRPDEPATAQTSASLPTGEPVEPAPERSATTPTVSEPATSTRTVEPAAPEPSAEEPPPDPAPSVASPRPLPKLPPKPPPPPKPWIPDGI